jgi:hypothetical protein
LSLAALNSPVLSEGLPDIYIASPPSHKKSLERSQTPKKQKVLYQIRSKAKGILSEPVARKKAKCVVSEHVAKKKTKDVVSELVSKRGGIVSEPVAKKKTKDVVSELVAKKKTKDKKVVLLYQSLLQKRRKNKVMLYWSHLHNSGSLWKV